MDLGCQAGRGLWCPRSHLSSQLVAERVQPEKIVFYSDLASAGLSFLICIMGLTVLPTSHSNPKA